MTNVNSCTSNYKQRIFVFFDVYVLRRKYERCALMRECIRAR